VTGAEPGKRARTSAATAAVQERATWYRREYPRLRLAGLDAQDACQAVGLDPAGTSRSEYERWLTAWRANQAE
jgi:hypothetical protein